MAGRAPDRHPHAQPVEREPVLPGCRRWAPQTSPGRSRDRPRAVPTRRSWGRSGRSPSAPRCGASWRSTSTIEQVPERDNRVELAARGRRAGHAAGTPAVVRRRGRGADLPARPADHPGAAGTARARPRARPACPSRIRGRRSWSGRGTTRARRGCTPSADRGRRRHRLPRPRAGQPVRGRQLRLPGQRLDVADRDHRAAGAAPRRSPTSGDSVLAGMAVPWPPGTTPPRAAAPFRGGQRRADGDRQAHQYGIAHDDRQGQRAGRVEAREDDRGEGQQDDEARPARPSSRVLRSSSGTSGSSHRKYCGDSTLAVSRTVSRVATVASVTRPGSRVATMRSPAGSAAVEPGQTACHAPQVQEATTRRRRPQRSGAARPTRTPG